MVKNEVEERWNETIVFLLISVYMVDLRVVKMSFSDEGINNGYAEGNLSVAELSKIINAVFVNQNRDKNGFIDVSLASELTLNWMLNVYDPWVNRECCLWLMLRSTL